MYTRSAALSRATPGSGRLVQRLDRDDGFYSIVSFSDANATAGVALVDARSGEYLQSAFPSEPGDDVIGLSASAAEKSIVGQRIDLGGDRRRLLVRPGAVARYPNLVWQPCRESLSPYYPFYMLIVGRHRIYVRVDGQVLTLDGAGVWRLRPPRGPRPVPATRAGSQPRRVLPGSRDSEEPHVRKATSYCGSSDSRAHRAVYAIGSWFNDMTP